MATHSKNLIWDLGNTLLKVDIFQLIKHLGPVDFLLYPLLDQKHPRNIYHRALDLLETINVPHKEPCKATAQGRPLPPVVCEWLSGNISYRQISNYLQTPLTKRVPKGFFKSEREARLVETLIKLFTDPQTFASFMQIVKEGVSLLEECAQQYDNQGNQRHSLFILSNWDPYSFTSITKSLHLQELFTYFEKSNVIISGEIGLIKPHDEIYSYLLSTYNLNPADCILIDDQHENIQGARKHGMTGILLKNGNYKQVRTQLKQSNVI